MLKRTLSLALAAVLASGWSARPARADCCDDFWSCVATIATGGISCKAQQVAAAMEGTKKLIAAVEAARSGFAKTSDDVVAKTKDDIGSAGDAMKHDLQRSLDEIRKSVSDTEAVVRKQPTKLSPPAGTGGAAGTGASAPAAERGGGGASLSSSAVADPARVQADLERALEWVQAARGDVDSRQAPLVRTNADEARKEVQKDEPVARKMVGDQLLNPLDDMKKYLEHILATTLNPFDFSSVTKYMDARIKLIQGRAPGTFDGMSQKLTAVAGDRLKQGQKTLDEVRKRASDSKKVADRAKQLAESGKKSDLDKLEALVGAPPSDVAVIAPGASPGSTARAPASSSVASLALLKTQGTAKAGRLRGQDLSAGLASQWDATRKLLPAGPVAITAAMQKTVADDLSKRFAGKSFPDARKTQQQLLDEARVKFGSDPKTLEAVERYLQAQTSSLIAASSAPIRK